MDIGCLKKIMIIKYEIEERLRRNRKAYNMRQVQCIETGEIFKSITDANEAVGGCTNNSRISKCCEDSSMTYKGYHWRYI